MDSVRLFFLIWAGVFIVVAPITVLMFAVEEFKDVYPLWQYLLFGVGLSFVVAVGLLIYWMRQEGQRHRESG